MADQLMTVEYLRRSQLLAIAETTQKLNGLVTAMPSVSNAMFQLAQRFAPESGPKEFKWWSYSLLVGAPYSVTELFDVYQRASYFEATIIYRHLLEAVVQLRFYEAHPERFLSDHEWEMRRAGHKNEAQKATRPSFKLMFDEVAPGHYEQFYSRWFSNAAHGGIVSSVFRFGGETLEEFAHIPGARYHEGQAAHLATHMIPVLHGLIRSYTRLHPDIFGKLAPEAQRTVDAALRFLAQASAEDWRTFPKKRPLLEQLTRLADWQKPLSEPENR